MPTAAAAAATESCRVLIVEDDPDAREVMALLAGQRADRQVRVAASVGEAMGELHDALPTHVLLDLMLPDYGGVELLRVVRSLNLPVRVAVVTASGPDSRAVAEASRWRPDAIFHKPVRFAEIEAWLGSE